MALTDLIAMGGTQVPSPIQRYIQSKQDMQKEQMNRLAIQSSQQQVGIQREANLRKRTEAYKAAVTPAMVALNEVPMEQRADYYQTKVLPYVTDVAQKLGIPVDQSSAQYDPDKHAMFMESLPKQEKWTQGVTEGGAPYQESTITGERKKGIGTETDVNKWQRVAALSRLIDAGKGTPGDKAEFEALTKPSIAITTPSPTKNVTRIAADVMPVLEVEGEKIEGEIENEDAYRAAISTRAQAIQAESGKTGKAIGLEEAVRQAHEEVKESLVPAGGIEIFGMTPFAKKWVYDPNKEVPEDTLQAQDISQPADLKEGESGRFGEYEYRRVSGKLQRKKAE